MQLMGMMYTLALASDLLLYPRFSTSLTLLLALVLALQEMEMEHPRSEGLIAVLATTNIRPQPLISKAMKNLNVF